MQGINRHAFSSLLLLSICHAGHKPSVQQDVSFTQVVDHTLKRANMPVLTLSGHKSMGRGFAKWIGRAVGTAGLKHKTELEDLPAYKLRVIQLCFLSMMNANSQALILLRQAACQSCLQGM